MCRILDDRTLVRRGTFGWGRSIPREGADFQMKRLILVRHAPTAATKAAAFPLDERMTMEIKGRHLIEGVPKTITITDEEIREALAETVNVIVDAVRVALERTPPELSADIVDRGIVLTGGGSMLKNLDKRLREETGLPLAMAEDPLSSVVLGAGKMLSDFNLLRKISID